MLNRIEVIIPYSRDSNIKRGDSFSPKGKNTIITGKNGCGKSSLVHMIYESLRIFRGKEFAPLVYSYFTLHTCSTTEPETSPVSTHRDSINSFTLSPERVLGELLRNADLVGIKGSRKVLQTKLEYQLPEKHPSGGIDDEYLDGLLNDNLSFLENEAKKENIDPEFIYGATLIALDRLINDRGRTTQEGYPLTDISTPITDFFYSELIGGNLNKFPIFASYYIPGMDQEEFFAIDKNVGEKFDLTGSKGEIQKKRLDLILERLSDRGGLVLLDEPLANMDEESQDVYSDKIFEASSQKGVQFMIASHDRSFNKEARNNSWYEIKL